MKKPKFMYNPFIEFFSGSYARWMPEQKLVLVINGCTGENEHMTPAEHGNN